MKYSILATIFTLLVVVAARKRCSSGDDCEQGQCCIAKGMLSLMKGYCTPLAQKGGSCSRKEHIYRNKYQKFCPCDGDLRCVPEKEIDLIFVTKIINPRCVSNTTTTQEPVTEVPTDATEGSNEETETPVGETEVPDVETEVPDVETEVPDEETEAPVVE